MKTVKKVFRFAKRSSLKEIGIALQLSYLLTIAYLQVNSLPLKYYIKKYSFSSDDISIDLQPFRMEMSILIKLKRYLPVRITCLMHAFATHSYLKKQGISAPIKLGLNTEEDLSAHAWVGNNQMLKEFKIIQL